MTLKKKYTMRLDRHACIGAGACVAVDPEHWKLVDDGKADLLGGTATADNAFHEYDFDEDRLALMKDAAESCPVVAIHIINNESGEHII